MFLLRKWYLDLITSDGTVLILYAARLRWRTLRLGYASVLHAAPAEPRWEEATIRRVEEPRLQGNVLRWQSDMLQVRGLWRRDTPPIRRTLARGRDGVIQWTCHMPRARASVTCRDAALDGVGYVESLRLTILPWKLPFRTLRWGRHASDRHSLVWIDWGGAGRDHRRWVWFDGHEEYDTALTESGLSGLAGGGELHLEGSRDVRDRRVLATLTDVVPALARLVGPLAGMHEHKQVDRSSIVRAGQPLDHGWTLHEVVTW